MWDFDLEKDYFYLVENTLFNAMLEFDLSNVYILESTNGFNAFSLDKVDFDTLLNIMVYTEFNDFMYYEVTSKKGYATLRMGRDKLFLSTLANNLVCDTEYEKSQPHYFFFRDIMGYPIIDARNMDNETYVPLCLFASSKHGNFDPELLKKLKEDDFQISLYDLVKVCKCNTEE